MASPIMRRRAGSCFVTAPRSKSSTCCSRSAARSTRGCVSACGSQRSPAAKTALSLCPIKASFALRRWWWQPAVHQFQRWDRAGSGTKIAEQFGLKIVPPRPALVPLTFDAALLAQFKDLSGVSVDAVVSCGKTRFDEALLFTHRGLSGPAILQVSSYWREADDVVIDMAPGNDVF